MILYQAIYQTLIFVTPERLRPGLALFMAGLGACRRQAMRGSPRRLLPA